jgi:hypothetical protein
MGVSDEIARLRKRAADLIEQAARCDTPLSPEEDAEILALLRQAQELETSDKRRGKAHDRDQSP